VEQYHCAPCGLKGDPLGLAGQDPGAKNRDNPLALKLLDRVANWLHVSSVTPGRRENPRNCSEFRRLAKMLNDALWRVEKFRFQAKGISSGWAYFCGVIAPVGRGRTKAGSLKCD
jgi:hypothetical protein